MVKRFTKLFIALFLLMCSQRGLALQLSGTYTINPSAAATAVNFQNIRSAVTYMTSTAARADLGPANSGTLGVSGAVTFVISAGTYNEQVLIPAITGASTTNTIVFMGAGKANTLLTFASADANNRHTLRLNLASNVTFRDMTIRANGATYAWAVQIMGLNSNNNKLKNCNIEVTGTGAGSTSTNYIAIVINNSVTAATTGTRVDGTEIDSCTIDAGYYGICAAGASANLHVGLRITNNRIVNSGVYGIYATYVNGIYMDNNYMFLRSSYQYNYGLYLLNSICTAPNKHVITRNQIFGFGYYGLYISGSSNLAGNKGLIANNMVGGLIKYEYSRCIYLTSTSNWRIAFNSLNHDYAGYSNQYGAAYITGGSGNSFINNICYEKIASQGIPLYASASTVFDTMNYNLFYRPDTLTGGLIYVGSVLNSGSFKGAAGQNTNSLYGNPMFPNDTLLNNANACFQGIPLPGIPTDYYGTTRSLISPKMGAYETPFILNNLAVLNVTNIVPPLVAGPTDLNIMIRNNGSNTVGSFNLTYTLNNGTPVVYPWSGTLNSCDTLSITFTGAQRPVLGTINNFKIYSSLPNTTADLDRTNDTIQVSYYMPLNGTYYIGGTAPDFAKPSEAFEALKFAGMTGPVRFEVRPGTYIDQITIDNPITGLTATNNITLAGTHRDSCIIQTNNTGASMRHTIRIGQSHIRLDSLTLRTNNANYGWVVHINKNNTRNVKIKNCLIENIHPNAFNSTSDVFMGVVFSGANNSPYYYDVFVLDSMEVDSNIVRNAYSGIWQYSYFYSYYYTYGAPSEALRFRNNQISNILYAGINTNGTGTLDISGNTIIMRQVSTSVASNYGMLIAQHDGSLFPTKSFKINNNKIWNANYMGMYLSNCLVSSSNRGQMFNNAIAMGYNNQNCYGLYISNLSNTSIYQNTVLNNQPATSNSIGALIFYTGSGIRMRNNHFVVSNASSMGTPAYLSGVNFTSPAEFNYNNFYRPDTTGTFVYLNSWFTGRAFIGSGGSNINSSIVNPAFLSDTLLITNNGCINGDTMSMVPNDITGAVRNPIPDIGAYEVATYATDAGASKVVSPVNPVTAGTQDLSVLITNHGTNTLTSANVGYKLNNNAPVIQLWTGSLGQCDTTSVIFAGINQITLLPGSVNTIKIFTNAPNSSPDNNPLNDTTVFTLATGMKGNYIVGPAPSDFLNLTAAGNALVLRGVDSVVNFLVKTGTYNEQLFLPAIVGASETNLITFRSLANHADSVLVTRNNTGTSDNYIVKLSGAKYINFFRMTLTAQGTTYGYVVEIAQNSGYCNFRECKLNTPVTTTTSANMAVVYGINNQFGNIGFISNTITGGSYGIYLRGTNTSTFSDNNRFDSNSVSNYYYMGMYTYYNSNQKIRRNNISTTSAYTGTYGIYGYYNDSAFEVTHNRIYTTTAEGYGINTFYCDGAPGKTGMIANNMVRIGTGAAGTNYGIRDQYSSYMLIANNSVLVNSTSTTAAYAGYFYYSSSISNTNRIRNNVFANNNSGGVLYHYNPLYGSSDYNLLYTTGTVNYVQRGTPANTYTSLLAFKTAVPYFEKNSLQYRPAYTSNTNLAPNPADTAAWLMNGRGTQLTEVTTDYNGNTRPGIITQGIPDLGAFEFTPTSTPPLCTAIPALPVAGGTQVFLIATDTVCVVVHDASSTAATSLAVRQYSGTNPPSVSPGDYHFKMYIDMIAPAGTYNFTLNLYYKNPWIYTNPSETDSRLAFKAPSGPWIGLLGGSSTIDTNTNIISSPFLSTYTVYTGTDTYLPLPVELLGFEGYPADHDAILLWQTASEKNSKEFEVERGMNPSDFVLAGKLKAAGFSDTKRAYVFEDKGALQQTGFAYYRLKMTDIDGSFTYSKVIKVGLPKSGETLVASPNPFKNSFVLNHVEANQSIEVLDIQGKMVFSIKAEKEGETRITLPAHLGSGMYFVKSAINGEIQVIKMIKE